MAGRLCLTGVVRIEGEAEERVLHGAQPRLVLVRTALEAGHPVTADALGLVLWPTAAPYSEGALRGVVAKVRAFLSDDATLENTGHCYRFVAGPASVDVDDAGRAMADAERATAEQRWADAAEAADSAVALLHDSLLPGVDAGWLDPWRARLERRGCRARRAGAIAHSALGHHDAARDLAEAAIEPDPFDEASHRTLMGVLLAAGNRSEAVRAYERLRTLLDEELGVGPDDETRSVYEYAVRDTPAPRGDAG